jgi:hypothetical protein
MSEAGYQLALVILQNMEGRKEIVVLITVLSWDAILSIC